jgi:hypothetical protein
MFAIYVFLKNLTFRDNRNFLKFKTVLFLPGLSERRPIQHQVSSEKQLIALRGKKLYF